MSAATQDPKDEVSTTEEYSSQGDSEMGETPSAPLKKSKEDSIDLTKAAITKRKLEFEEERPAKKRRTIERRKNPLLDGNDYKFLKLKNFHESKFEDIKDQIETYCEEVNFDNRHNAEFKQFSVEIVPTSLIRLLMSEEEKKERGKESRRKYSSKEEVREKRKLRTQSEEYKKKMKELQQDERIKEQKKECQKINRKTLRILKEKEHDKYLKARKIAEEELKKRTIQKYKEEAEENAAQPDARVC